jgi:hypothetical protein
MKICLPAITTAGLFTAIVILDMINSEFKLIFGHSLLGFISILLILYLCEKSSDFVAWILLATPFVLIFLGWSIGALRGASGKVPQVLSKAVELEQAPMYGYGYACGSCQEYPCHCNEASVEKPSSKPTEKKKIVQDSSGNELVTCGGNTGKSQCIDVKGLPSA